MTGIRTVGVVGLGLIGGSLARDLAARGVCVIAFDRDAATLRAALDSGIVDSALDAGLANAADADVIVLAVPVLTARDILLDAADHLRRVRLVTDVCSTKYTLAAAARDRRLHHSFIGGHPLAGDHRTGWEESRTGLFRDAAVYICPDADASAEARSLVHELWASVGGVPQIVDPSEHDRLLAWISHLPQVTSTALARALAAAGISPASLGPGGRDMTRLARSSADMWTDIALDNAGPLGTSLERLERELAALRAALSARDVVRLRDFFERVPPSD